MEPFSLRRIKAQKRRNGREKVFFIPGNNRIALFRDCFSEGK